MNFLAIILANLPALVSGAKATIDLVNTVRDTAKQSGEWTEAHEVEFQKLIDAQKQSARWQADPQ